MLERASLIDPDYAAMWLSLADRYYYEGHYGGGGSGALRRSEAWPGRRLRSIPIT